MKKLYFSVIFILMMIVMVGQAMATWTLTATKQYAERHYIKVKIVCVSDGNSLSATNVMGLGASVSQDIKGRRLMLMKVSPSTGSTAPDTNISVTLTDSESETFFSGTGYSNTESTWSDLRAQTYDYLPILGPWYLAINDIGDSGDTVTLYFILWREEVQ